MNFNEIKPEEAGILLNEKNANIGLILVLIYELIDDKIINVRYEQNNVFIKLNNVSLNEINKLNVDKRNLIKILFDGKNDKKEYVLSEVLDDIRNTAISRKIVEEIIKNIKTQVHIKYNESFLDRFYEYSNSKFLVSLVSWVTIAPSVIFLIINFMLLITSKPYSGLMLCLYVVLVTLVIYANNKKYIKKKYIEEVNKLNGLKRFLLEFSNLKNYELKYVELYDKYYLYALSTGITNKVEKDYKIRSYLIDNISSNLKYLTYDKGDSK